MALADLLLPVDLVSLVDLAVVKDPPSLLDLVIMDALVDLPDLPNGLTGLPGLSVFPKSFFPDLDSGSDGGAALLVLGAWVFPVLESMGVCGLLALESREGGRALSSMMGDNVGGKVGSGVRGEIVGEPGVVDGQNAGHAPPRSVP